MGQCGEKQSMLEDARFLNNVVSSRPLEKRLRESVRLNCNDLAPSKKASNLVDRMKEFGVIHQPFGASTCNCNVSVILE